MTEAEYARLVLGPVLRWRRGKHGRWPNNADADSKSSREIAAHWAKSLGEFPNQEGTPSAQRTGARFVQQIRRFLEAELTASDRGRAWRVLAERPITDFTQYLHLGELARLVGEDETGVLEGTLAQEYLIVSDVVVAVPNNAADYLHAAVSCKWTIRSDRVQNARHEAVSLLRHRRGRAPHIVVVTAEPLPSRLSGIARGTGEIDCVYHVHLGHLESAVETVAPARQKRDLARLVRTGRLRDLRELPRRLLK